MTITTFLMFEGNALEAMTLYTSIFKSSKIDDLKLYNANEAGKEGTVMTAKFTLSGREFMCIDSPSPHQFTFTPAMSLFVTCNTEEELDTIFGKLSENGKVLMPLGSYGFSKKFGWCDDRFGVSWQLNLE